MLYSIDVSGHGIASALLTARIATYFAEAQPNRNFALGYDSHGMIVGLPPDEVAALFGTAVLTVIPVIQFSGFFTPVSSLSGGPRVMGLIFPSTYFMQISLGAFTKALGFAALAPHFWALLVIVVAYLGISLLLLRTQER